MREQRSDVVGPTHRTHSRPPPSERAALALLLLLLSVAGVKAWSWWQDRSYVGSTQSVSLTWQCGNGIFWESDRGVRWWAGDEPVTSGSIQTTAPTRVPDMAGLDRHEATGSLRFDSYSSATFTSDAGGTMHFTRQPRQAMYAAYCGNRSPP